MAGAECIIATPAFAVPYSSRLIGSANTHMPTEAGTVIRQHSFIAVAAFCSIICHLFKAKASETAGTRLVASDIVGIVAIKSKGCAMPAR